MIASRGTATKKPGGVALLAVLTVLTVLSLLAATFSAFMTMESQTSVTTLAKSQSDLLAQSALEHALSVLRQDVYASPGWDSPDEPWCKEFQADPKSPNQVNISDALSRSPSKDLPAVPPSRWFYVRDNAGNIQGRYAIAVEDEASKINVNIASAVMDSDQNEGFSTREVILSDGQTREGRGLPLSKEATQKLIKHRYGRDAQPGQANVDDNYNLPLYAGDKIDNNANQKVDEAGEGLDEAEEFMPDRPRWDDMAFTSMQDVIDICMPGQRSAATEWIKHLGTTYTHTRDMYVDSTSKIYNRVNINVAEREQIRRIFRRANSDYKFEPSTVALQSLVANVIDYRDENHVLTTVGNEYGVEAVNFNEIMANDGSYSFEADRILLGTDATDNAHLFSKWYNWNGSGARNTAFAITSKSPSSGGSVDYFGKRESFSSGYRVKLANDHSRVPNKLWNNFKRLMNRKWGGIPKNLLKGGTLVLTSKDSVRIGWYPILDNSGNDIHVGCGTTLAKADHFTNDTLYATLYTGWSWECLHAGVISIVPKAQDIWAFPTQIQDDIRPPKDLYYYAFIGEQNFTGSFGTSGDSVMTKVLGKSFTVAWKGFNEFMDLDGEANKYSETRMVELRKEDLKGSEMKMPGGEDRVWMKRYPYKDGDAVRAVDGLLPLIVSTAKTTGLRNGASTSSSVLAKTKNVFDVVYIQRPDVVELINISDRDISLRNWRVVINTGDYADQIAIIESAPHFNSRIGSLYDDPNPVIPANGYFYLTNNRHVFDYTFGASRNGTWGDTVKESYPCYELPDVLWGVRYKIARVSGDKLWLSGANWKHDQMKYEIIEIHSPRTESGRNGVTGIRKSVHDSGSNWIQAQPGISWNTDGAKSGDDAMFLGIPREGGFLSMTMKNEYGQIAARTVEYGTLKPNELTCSTQKNDPTHYTWVKTTKPTIGGTLREAENHNVRSRAESRAYVKNSPYATVGELRKVRRSGDWENIGTGNKTQEANRYMQAIAKSFTTYGVRMDAEEEGAHLGGWRPAFGTVAKNDAGKLQAKDVNWEPGIWEGQKLRISSGKQKDQVFVVKNSTASSITPDGYSVGAQETLHATKGDKFSIGPGYGSAMFYTRQPQEKGEWEWVEKSLTKQPYGLYIFGLNDSIKTTEFLEENHNATIKVEVYNYDTGEYEEFPRTSISDKDINDPYQITVPRHLQANKSDGFFCGLIGPEHVSSKGGIKVRLTPSGLHDADCSGFAWFDYAYLTPCSTMGQININTAPPRILASLPGVSAKLAEDIYRGIAQNGKAELKPYKNITDILSVRGMTVERYSHLCALITTRSDQFRVRILAESLNDVNRDGEYDESKGDYVTSYTSQDVIVDRQALMDGEIGESSFRFLSKQQ
ncbi:general secretion pathway protein GspK [bacterium]|nr:general secretion pathway protein GspK [bacterium]